MHYLLNNRFIVTGKYFNLHDSEYLYGKYFDMTAIKIGTKLEQRNYFLENFIVTFILTIFLKNFTESSYELSRRIETAISDKGRNITRLEVHRKSLLLMYENLKIENKMNFKTDLISFYSECDNYETNTARARYEDDIINQHIKRKSDEFSKLLFTSSTKRRRFKKQ